MLDREQKAEKLGRRWIGIDITHVAVGLIENRLRSAFSGIDFAVHGTPMDLDAARDFFARDDKTKKEFEKWAVTRIGFLPQTKKGADGGMDGMRWFGAREEHKAIVSVKGGKAVPVGDLRSLDAVVTAQMAQVGVLLALERPTKDAHDWARQAGMFEVEGFPPVPRLQIVTIAEALVLRDRAVKLPALAAAVKPAPKEAARPATGDLFSGP